MELLGDGSTRSAMLIDLVEEPRFLVLAGELPDLARKPRESRSLADERNAMVSRATHTSLTVKLDEDLECSQC